ncbi:MAG: twin-arginine translocation signal domain-containing protein, partial [Planctomycetota bacterium]
MKKHQISRRRFLKGAALGAAAVTIQPILSSRPLYAANPGIQGRTVVIINCFGGNDGLNMVVPTTLQPYVDRRPNINLVETANLPANESLQVLNSGYSLHYSLKNLKAIWDDDDLHVVHKVSYPSPNQSHFTSMDIMSYGVRNNEADGDGRGWLGRFADLYCASPVEPLGVIAVGMGRRR